MFYYSQGYSGIILFAHLIKQKTSLFTNPSSVQQMISLILSFFATVFFSTKLSHLSLCLTSELTDGQMEDFILLQNSWNWSKSKLHRILPKKFTSRDGRVAENFPDILIWIIPHNNHPPLHLN